MTIMTRHHRWGNEFQSDGGAVLKDNDNDKVCVM